MFVSSRSSNSTDQVKHISISQWQLDSPDIPKSGNVSFNIEFKNNTSSDQHFLIWLDGYLSNGEPYAGNPLCRPINMHLDPDETSNVRGQLRVPYTVPSGKYKLCLVVGPELDNEWDSKSLELTVLPIELKQNVCNLCGNEVSYKDRTWNNDDHTLVQCPSCSLVFDMEVQQEELPETENELFFDVGNIDAGVYHGIEQYLSKKNELVFEAEIERIRKDILLLPNQKLLDFGCGVGVLLSQARLKEFEVYGIEANLDALEHIRKNSLFPAFETLEEARDKLGPNSLDVIVTHHVLEHVSNPSSILKGLNELLRRDGLIVIVVPHFNSVVRTLPNEIPALSWKLIDRGHKYYYTEQTMKQYLVNTGFNRIQSKPLVFGGFAMRMLNDRVSIEMKRKVIQILKIVTTVIHQMKLEPILTVYAKKL